MKKFSRFATAGLVFTAGLSLAACHPPNEQDSESGKIVMEILQKLNDQGRTIFLITHETYTAGYAKRVIQLLDGRVESQALVNARVS